MGHRPPARRGGRRPLRARRVEHQRGPIARACRRCDSRSRRSLVKQPTPIAVRDRSRIASAMGRVSRTGRAPTSINAAVCARIRPANSITTVQISRASRTSSSITYWASTLQHRPCDPRPPRLRALPTGPRRLGPVESRGQGVRAQEWPANASDTTPATRASSHGGDRAGLPQVRLDRFRTSRTGHVTGHLWRAVAGGWCEALRLEGRVGCARRWRPGIRIPRAQRRCHWRVGPCHRVSVRDGPCCVAYRRRWAGAMARAAHPRGGGLRRGVDAAARVRGPFTPFSTLIVTDDPPAFVPSPGRVALP